MISRLEFKILILIPLIIAGIIIIPNYNQFIEKLGFETRTTLTAEREQLKKVNEELETANKLNNDLRKKMEELDQKKQTIEKELIDDRAKYNKIVTVVIQERDKAIAELKKKRPVVIVKSSITPTTKPSEVVVDMDVVNEISRVNIMTLWEAYMQLEGDQT